MTVPETFGRWTALCRYAERFGYGFPPYDDQSFKDHMACFLAAASELQPSEQFILREHMHDYGCPYALHLFEQKVLNDFLWWQPSALSPLQLNPPANNRYI